ncbi:MAG: glycosyltransferase family 4 protein [archaeon]
MKAVIIAPFFDSIDKMSFGPYPFVYNLIKGLNERMDLLVVTSGWPKKPAESIVDGVRVFRVLSFPSPLEFYKSPFLSFSFGFKRILKEKPDIINAQDFDGVMPLFLSKHFSKKTKRILSIKSFTSLRLAEVKDRIKFNEKFFVNIQGRWENFALKQSEKFICPSNTFIELLSNENPFLKGKTHRIYNGVDTSLFNPAALNSDLSMLFMGGSIEKKGVYFALAAFRILKKEFPELKLKIIGSNTLPDKAVFLKELSTKELKDITLLGRVSHKEIPKIVNESTIVLNPSFFESFGSFSVEAMACGKPVVAFDMLVMKEVIGNAGVFAEALNYNDFINKTRILLDDKQLRLKLGRNGVERVKKNFTLKQSIDEYCKLFEMTVGE